MIRYCTYADGCHFSVTDMGTTIATDLYGSCNLSGYISDARVQGSIGALVQIPLSFRLP